VRAESGDAVLVVSSLRPSPPGKTYEIWVAPGGRPLRAGLFEAESGGAVVRLSERVPAGAKVMVTLERAGGSAKPTGPVLLASSRRVLPQS